MEFSDLLEVGKKAAQRQFVARVVPDLHMGDQLGNSGSRKTSLNRRVSKPGGHHTRGFICPTGQKQSDFGPSGPKLNLIQPN